MSVGTWPVLPGLQPSVVIEPIGGNTDIETTLGGKEWRTATWTTARNKYHLSYGLRGTIQAPSPWGAYTEIALILYWIQTAKGSWDTFTYVDPLGTSKTVRLDTDSLTVTKDEAGVWWTVDVVFVEVI